MVNVASSLLASCSSALLLRVSYMLREGKKSDRNGVLCAVEKREQRRPATDAISLLRVSKRCERYSFNPPQSLHHAALAFVLISSLNQGPVGNRSHEDGTCLISESACLPTCQAGRAAWSRDGKKLPLATDSKPLGNNHWVPGD